MTIDILRLLHIGLASFWLASIIKDIFEPLNLQGSHEENRRLIIHREKAAGMMGTISGVGTILSGAALLFMIGFSGNPWALNMGIVVALVMALIGALGVGGSYQRIIKAFDREASNAELKSLAIGLRKWSLALLALWLLTFFLMGLRNLILR